MAALDNVTATISRDFVEDSQLQQAIDILEDAVERAAHDQALALEMKIELGTTLYVADEFSRAAAILDEILPELAGRDDVGILYYYAGISHAEIGVVEPAIERLTTFLTNADRLDPLYRDAKYQLGMMLSSIGRAAEGLRHLEGLRPLLVAEYGGESIHVSALDRRITQIRQARDRSI